MTKICMSFPRRELREASPTKAGLHNGNYRNDLTAVVSSSLTSKTV